MGIWGHGAGLQQQQFPTDCEASAGILLARGRGHRAMAVRAGLRQTGFALGRDERGDGAVGLAAMVIWLGPETRGREFRG